VISAFALALSKVDNGAMKPLCLIELVATLDNSLGCDFEEAIRMTAPSVRVLASYGIGNRRHGVAR
jgi:hypothetical protein